MSTLFTAHTLGALTLNNRLVMPPLTRARSTQAGDVPNAMMAEYYAQRASAGFIIAEATDISAQGKGYSNTPGVYTAAQIEGWKLVTDAVHAKGGKIFLQIWHTGRMSHTHFHGGALPVAPSAVSFEGQIWLSTDASGSGSMVDCPTPRALETAEIAQVVQDFKQAAINAIAAGFDGVEIHGANSYLIDQFLRTSSNLRTDVYGGSRDTACAFWKKWSLLWPTPLAPSARACACRRISARAAWTAPTSCQRCWRPRPGWTAKRLLTCTLPKPSGATPPPLTNLSARPCA